MLSYIDKYQNVLLSVFLIAYILNSIYIGSGNLSLVLFFFVVIIQIIRLRKHIKQLSFIQLAAIVGILLGGLTGLVLVITWLNHVINIGMLSFPDWLISVIHITLILVFLITVTAIVQKQFLRFTCSKT
ncbi:hypothetical protein [Paenisporosarcina indica]|uniref:hypothetical protein n=1 Tax=Paenisporosarcina indica TaxID=650093 RepID=UPI00094F7B2A|nr:hypothetical protein [Paenisporosarcina indica]